MKNKSIIVLFLYLMVLIAAVYSIYMHDYMSVFVSFLTILSFLLVNFVIKRFKINIPFFLQLFICIFIFCAAILGEIFNFYLIIDCWDNILHFSFGFMCTYVCFLIFKKYIKIKTSSILLIGILFSFFCSLSLSTVWEFMEFSFDKYLDTDMQKDTLLGKINTTYFNTKNKVMNIDDITETKVYNGNNDVDIKNGYLDIGLYDTIMDLVAGTFGALFSVLIILFLEKNLIFIDLI